MKTHRIVVVTPAGRRAYLDLLRHYILRDRHVEEWHLWDNCRHVLDREYIESLARGEDRIRIVRMGDADGSNRCINAFYSTCSDSGTFYIKMDDDIVHLGEGTASNLLATAVAEKERFLWWSPVVVNNALCSWLLQQRGVLDTDRELTAQASCATGWKDPRFAVKLHRAFLAMLSRGERIVIPDSTVSLSRFSINCIGFFGEDVARYGSLFCPSGVSDEEWISAALPLRTGRPGRIVGAGCVAHYSFYPQERLLNSTDVLDGYYALAGIPRRHGLPKGNPLWDRGRLRRAIGAFAREIGVHRLGNGGPRVELSP